MYAFLFRGLTPVLKIAVAAYVVVIALMAAQAIGRATVLRDRASIAVAVGAVFFMVSDSLLAINKFALPLPMAQFWVLATYYVAQLLIAAQARPARAKPLSSPLPLPLRNTPLPAATSASCYRRCPPWTARCPGGARHWRAPARGRAAPSRAPARRPTGCDGCRWRR